MTRFHSFLRHQGLALAALLVALGGTSYAVTQLPRNSVGPAQLRHDAVTGPDVKESTLRGVDAARLGGIKVSSLGTGRSASASCQDDDHDAGGQACGSVSITLPRPSRLLLLLDGKVFVPALDDVTGVGSGGDAPTYVAGQCNVAVDGGVAQVIHDFTARVALQTGVLSGNAVTAVLPKGVHVVEVRCFEQDGDVDFRANLSAVVLGSD